MLQLSRLLVCAYLCVLATPLFAAAGAAKDGGAPEPRLLPWKLRDHYTFAPEGFQFIYGGDNGQWSLTKADDLLMDKVNSSVTFADGKTIESALHGVGVTNRNAYTGELGPGIEYIVNIPPKDGISLRHSVAYHSEHPFYLLRLEVKNVGTAPIEVAKISSVIIPPGSLKSLGTQTTVSHRRFTMQGPCPVYSPDAAPYATFIHDPATGLLLGMGSLSNGQSKTTVELQPFSGAWQGSVTSVFDPPVRVEPGQTIKGDATWISFITPTQKDVDLFYAHACKNFPKPAQPDSVPNAWVTVPDGESFADLQAARTDWGGIGAALVPVTWEARGGSQDGAAPAWPREMRGVASQLRQGGAAGITVDPLAIAEMNDAWSAKSEDGQIWVNPAVPEGMAHGVARMKKIAGWGFDFYAVSPSRIPNEVLKNFNITRARADALAMDMMIAASGGAPVFAASQGALGGGRDEWLAAAAATARLGEYNVVTAPIRFDAARGKDISDETATAIAFCGAPVEVIGSPSAGARKAVADAVARRDFFARPLDLASPAPMLWQVETTPNASKENLAISIVSFEGARASAADDANTYSGTPAKTSNAAAAGYVAQLPSGSKAGKSKPKK
ncbi:MAG: hypothetical protein SGI88_09440 [Candidatus Hydrogenedentes bacterium]|nr:hypothetical protein [Candidatus Hydrogenedentota bacterium]